MPLGIFLTYSPDGTNVYGSKGGEHEGILFSVEAESCKIMFTWGTSYSLVLHAV